MKKIFRELKWHNFIFLTIAGIINAVGVTLFLSPVELLDGGLSGTSLFLDKITPSYLNMSMFLIVLNFPFYILAHKKIGFQFIIYSLFAISIYSLFAFIFKDLIVFDYKNLGSPIGGKDLLLCSLFGGLLSGVGSGMTIRFGGALDGVEVMAIMCSKRIGITVGTFVMLYNIILYCVCAILNKSWEIALYSVIAYYIGVKTVDFLVDGLDKAKAVTIITNKYDEVCKVLSDEFGRGLTIIEAKGYFSNANKYMIYCVVNRFELTKLKRLIMMTDDEAFVTINESSDAIGNRFKLSLRKDKNKKLL